MKKVAIIQSNYIPWKGYFDIIHDVDCFIFYDNVQYTKQDWRNRNKIKTPDGYKWLVVPVGVSLDRTIQEVRIDNTKNWAKKHYLTIKQFYNKAKYFREFDEFLYTLYVERIWETLSELNQFIIKEVCREFLGIKTEFANASDFDNKGDKTEKLVNLVKEVQGDYYISGPAAKDYIDESLFVNQGIKLVYKDYSGYPEYNQLYSPFNHAVTIFDLLFNVGKENAYKYIWGWRT